MSKQDNNRIEKLISKAGGVTGKTQDSTETLTINGQLTS